MATPSTPASTRPAPAPTTPGDLSGAPSPGGREGSAFARALESLSRRINLERSKPVPLDASAWKLDRMAALLAALEHPEAELVCAHVAGSKGKGSVVEMSAAALSGCGLATGIYTSPHLVDIRERIRIGTELIPHADFARWCEEVSAAAAKIAPAHGEPSYFEIITAMALCHFRERAVDCAVLEVGLGGRLDATNLVTPRVCAVAAIQLEHTQILGDTHAKIAREKAGIMKPGVPCVTFAQRDDVMAVLREVASEKGASLQVLGEDLEFTSRIEHSRELGQHAKVCLYSPRSAFEHVTVPMRGEHQTGNCGLALAIVDRLRETFPSITEAAAARGLASTASHGRLEVVWRDPRVVVDGAHTPDSVEALIRTLPAQARYDSLVMVFGCASDKDVPGMVRAVGHGADKVYFTRAANNPRSADPRELTRRYAEATGRSAAAAGSVDEAMRRALQTATRGDLIVVTGSYYVAGEAKAWVQRNLGK